jgi:hypothetical protein
LLRFCLFFVIFLLFLYFKPIIITDTLIRFGGKIVLQSQAGEIKMCNTCGCRSKKKAKKKTAKKKAKKKKSSR